MFLPVLQTLDDWSFDVFALNEAASGQPIKYLGYDLLNRYGIIHKFKVSPDPLGSGGHAAPSLSPWCSLWWPQVPPTVLETLLGRIEEGYSRHKNPYHNNLHAADVAQGVHYMLCQTGLMVSVRGGRCRHNTTTPGLPGLAEDQSSSRAGGRGTLHERKFSSDIVLISCFTSISMSPAFRLSRPF